MSKKEFSHLDSTDRINIQAGIAKKIPLSGIAKTIKKDRSTVFREIRNNSYVKTGRRTCSHCKHHNVDCPRTDKTILGPCEFFIPIICEKLKKYPYCCNNCEKNPNCCEFKRYYDCTVAINLAKERLKQSRSHPQLKQDQIQTINEVISPGIKNGQSIHHVYSTNKIIGDFCSEKTIRRYLYKGVFDAKTFDLPRYTRFSHNYDYKRLKPRNIQRLYQRTYKDFKDYVEEHPDSKIWQYDSVIGAITDKKAILTITYPKYRFQFGLLVSKGSSYSFIAKINYLIRTLGAEFYNIFQTNLCDNGMEFETFYKLENLKKNYRVYYTNPYHSYEKGACERNHEFIRMIIPKGKSMDDLTQEKLNLIFSHINSYVRSSNQNKTPYRLMVEEFGTTFLEKIGISEVPAKDVTLKEKLIK